MSWHPDSRRATWIEGLRGSETKRVQIVTLPEYKAGPAVAPRAVPDSLPYGDSDLSTLPALAGKSQNIDGSMAGGRAISSIGARAAPSRNLCQFQQRREAGL
ncbi:hypothetical protein [Sphingobium yanoikuyae]|uniref:hypothetical protein n=1 Tax=Sphingobium yanoikuyae TaxID=13690 RepID=UPI00345E121C